MLAVLYELVAKIHSPSGGVVALWQTLLRPFSVLFGIAWPRGGICGANMAAVQTLRQLCATNATLKLF